MNFNRISSSVLEDGIKVPAYLLLTKYILTKMLLLLVEEIRLSFILFRRSNTHTTYMRVLLFQIDEPSTKEYFSNWPNWLSAARVSTYFCLFTHQLPVHFSFRREGRTRPTLWQVLSLKIHRSKDFMLLTNAMQRISELKFCERVGRE